MCMNAAGTLIVELICVIRRVHALKACAINISWIFTDMLQSQLTECIDDSEKKKRRVTKRVKKVTSRVRIKQ